jgi:uncharacterized membrane protein
MIIPTFFIALLCVLFIIIGMVTKSSDTSTYKDFKTSINENVSQIEDVEDKEDVYTLALTIIGGIILLICLILLICFCNEKTCFENYNPKCKVPYYFTMMLINIILTFVNAIIAFVFCGYRTDTIDKYSVLFESSYKNNNDLNIILLIFMGIFYLVCFILHLFICYYLFKEDRICVCCCGSFLDCIRCCNGIIKCLCCCCCCADCSEIPSSQTVYVQPPVQQEVVVIAQTNPQNPYNNNVAYNNNNNVVYNNNNNNNVAYNNNNNNNNQPGILNQLRDLLPGSVKRKVDSACNKTVYNNSYSQFVNCIICNLVFQNGQEILIFPCGHICHSNCGYNYFSNNNKNCPVDGTIVIN